MVWLGLVGLTSSLLRVLLAPSSGGGVEAAPHGSYFPLDETDSCRVGWVNLSLLDGRVARKVP